MLGYPAGLLGGSWVVISRVINLLIWVITVVTLPITPIKATHEAPSRIEGSWLPRVFQVWRSVSDSELLDVFQEGHSFRV